MTEKQKESSVAGGTWMSSAFRKLSGTSCVEVHGANLASIGRCLGTRVLNHFSFFHLEAHTIYEKHIEPYIGSNERNLQPF